MSSALEISFTDAWPSMLRAALEAALAGGAAVMEVYGRDFAVDYKADHSPLTEADRASHECILARLACTGLPVLSEESESAGPEERRHWSTLWLVDPLDGTKEFVKRNGDFTVNIALIHDHRPLLGVVYVPVRRELYVGVSGVGAFRVEGRDDAQALERALEAIPGLGAPFVPLRGAMPSLDPLRVVASLSHSSPETREFIASLQGSGRRVEQVSRGSSLKLCMVASGEAHLYPRLAPTMEWDTAAAQAVVECAGGVVVVYDAAVRAAFGRRGLSALFEAQPLAYNRDALLNPGFVALHPTLKDL